MRESERKREREYEREREKEREREREREGGRERQRERETDKQTERERERGSAVLLAGAQTCGSRQCGSVFVLHPLINVYTVNILFNTCNYFILASLTTIALLQQLKLYHDDHIP